MLVKGILEQKNIGNNFFMQTKRYEKQVKSKNIENINGNNLKMEFFWLYFWYM